MGCKAAKLVMASFALVMGLFFAATTVFAVEGSGPEGASGAVGATDASSPAGGLSACESDGEAIYVSK